MRHLARRRFGGIDISEGMGHMATNAHDDEPGRCWSCDYLLRGVESGRCPECGRAFDRNDQRSMNLGPRIGAWGRRALRPPGVVLTLFAVIAAGMVVGGTGLISRWDFWRWDVTITRWEIFKEHWAIDSPRWHVFVLGIGLSLVVAIWWIVRLTARGVYIMVCTPPREVRGRMGWRAAVLLTCVLIAGLW